MLMDILLKETKIIMDINTTGERINDQNVLRIIHLPILSLVIIWLGLAFNNCQRYVGSDHSLIVLED